MRLERTVIVHQVDHDRIVAPENSPDVLIELRKTLHAGRQYDHIESYSVERAAEGFFVEACADFLHRSDEDRTIDVRFLRSGKEIVFYIRFGQLFPQNGDMEFLRSGQHENFPVTVLFDEIDDEIVAIFVLPDIVFQFAVI